MTNFKRNNMINDAIGYTVAAIYAALIISLTVGIVITAIG
jgi:flagellar biosynthesis protein FliQ